MLTQPVGQLATPDPAGREIEHEAFLIVYGSDDLSAVEEEKGLHGRVAHALVAMTGDREAQRRGLLNQRVM